MSRRAGVLAWGLLVPMPSIAAICAVWAFVGTSFHNPSIGGLVGLALFALVARAAAKMGRAHLTAFLVGVALVIAAAVGIVLYAITHMGPLG